MELLKRLVMEEEGATMAEYGLIVALIAVVAAGGATILGGQIEKLFTEIAGKLGYKAPTT
ncbi:Flp family type IVb pilin [Lysinibacillus sp. BW-2-10]|uniref:Flp family type IVb pilin n=1 Tax=Lysinibacillus sp. BW-2-10 TaxID=2590030 RepID=UPI00117FE0F4|nr:Flp family type IVb pilin [Lysinibacillus sp. BW-2-10]TSI02286.1 Flp family type IVb pilin [Lysinibacillus sp. BW-2-10]